MSFSISPPLIFLTSYHGFSFIPFPKPRTFWIFPLPHPMSVGLWVTAEMPLHPSTADILSAFWGAPQCSWFPPQLSGLALEKVNLIILFHLKTSVTPVTSPIISVLLIISFYNLVQKPMGHLQTIFLYSTETLSVWKKYRMKTNF